MTALVQQQSNNPVRSWRVAIIDDVYAGPSREDLNELAAFCAEIEADDDLAEIIRNLTDCNFADERAVTPAGILALHKSRGQLTEITEQLNKLFVNFDYRLKQVKTIEDNLKAHGWGDSNIKTFKSVEDLFSGEPFQLVFLDLLLAKGDSESKEIAKQIYEKFKAFILLMSDSPSPVKNPQQVEQFRRDTRLLRGFFEFQSKSNLCDPEQFHIQMVMLPQKPEVCHAVHNFVIALEKALGGEIEELPIKEASSLADVTASVLPKFMHTLRDLDLQDYALLCELTLLNEGHPLGDYMMRLLGPHLIAQLISHQGVKDAVTALDSLQFTEFLPFSNKRSQSFHRLFTDATTEVITGSWKPHPWSKIEPASVNGDIVSRLEEEVGESEDSKNVPQEQEITSDEQRSIESEILNLLGFEDDNRELPYLQLGDLFIKDEKSLVFAVINAPCDLQFVPSQVHNKRERLRDDSILLVPGRFRKIEEPKAKKSQTMAGLIELNETAYCVDWFDGKLLGLPHCSLRKLLEERGYQHLRRLQTARALELQQAVLTKLSRIGLEVRPPFPRDTKITLFKRNGEKSFARLGESVKRGGLLLQGRTEDKPMLFLRKNAFFYFVGEMKKYLEQINSGAGTPQKQKVGWMAAEKAFRDALSGLKRPILISSSGAPKPIQLLDGSGSNKTIKQVAIRFGKHTDPLESTNQELMFCLSVEEE